jgi:hypothetical protein
MDLAGGMKTGHGDDEEQECVQRIGFSHGCLTRPTQFCRPCA